MSDNIKKILSELLNDEVDVNHEWNRLSSKIEEGESKRVDNVFRGRISKWGLSAIKYAAAILLGIICSLSSVYYVQNNKPNKASTYKLMTAKGERTHIILPDGSNVWLNSCTSIEYSTDYGYNNRDIKLDGEAYFEVAKDKTIPFIVKTNGGIDVRAVGTAFNVEAYSNDDFVETILYNGKVLVQPTLTKQEIVLSPNQAAIYNKEKHSIVVSDNKDNSAQWRSGIIVFDMADMKDITKHLERSHNVVFKYQNQRIKERKFTGSFDMNEPIKDIVKIIKINTGLDFIITQDTITIK